jgi:hypothetical protein
MVCLSLIPREKSFGRYIVGCFFGSKRIGA